jgi:DNA polymerase I-like protein with 3'-5' exonuclease and polymerase domains
MSILQNEKSGCKCNLLSNAHRIKELNIAGSGSEGVLFLMAHPHPRNRYSLFVSILKRNGYNADNSYFLNALGCAPLDFVLPETHQHYLSCKYYNIRDKISSIKPKVIVTEGNAIWSIVDGTNIRPHFFYNYELLPTTFYAPEFSAWVVPLPPLEGWIGETDRNDSIHVMSNFPAHFVIRQLKTIKYNINRPFVKERYKVTMVKDYDKEFDRLLTKDLSKCAVDLETTGLKYFNDKIISIQLCVDGYEGLFFEWRNDPKFIRRVDDFLSKCPCQIYANGIFDLKFLIENGINNAHIDFDVNYAGHFIYSARGNSLKANSYYHTGFGGYDNELDSYIRKYNLKSYMYIPKDVLGNYAAIDAIVTYKLEEILLSYMTPAQKDLFFKTYLPLANLFAQIERKGMYIDIDYLRKYRNECYDKMKELEDKIHSKRPGVNLKSDEKLGDMFKEMKAKCYGVTKKGKYKTNEDILLKWRADGISLVDEILEYKGYNKLVTSYLSQKSPKSILSGYNIRDGRTHAHFNFQRTWVGRLSCNSPNLQQMPIKSNPKFRPIFRAPNGYLLAECDFAGFHLRLVAMASDDESLKKMFTSDNRDMHSKTAAAIFTDYTFEEYVDKLHNGASEEKKKLKEYRDKSKPISFGFIYGMAYKTFARDILLQPPPDGWTQEEVNEYIKENNIKNLYDYLNIKRPKNVTDEVENRLRYDVCAKLIRSKFFKEYRGVERWIEKLRSEGLQKGYVESMYGFRIWIPEYTYKSYENHETHYSNLRNISVNGPIIATEANIMDRAMVQINQYFRNNNLDAHIVNQVHDSLVIEFKEDLLDIIRDPIKSIMTRDYPEYNGIPIDAEGMYSVIWGGVSDYPWNFWFDSSKD